MPRGRPKKIQESTTNATTFTDGDGGYKPIEETKHEHTVRQIKLEETWSEANKTVKSWIVKTNGKFVKKSQKANGNVSSTFVCLDQKENQEYINKLKKEYEFRAS